MLAVPNLFPVNQWLKEAALTSQEVLDRRFKDPDCPAVTLKPFADTPFILLTPGNNLYSRSKKFFKEASVSPKITMEVTQLITSFHLSQAGIGATFISDWMLTNTHPEMSFYKIASPTAIRTFDIVTSGRNYLSKAQQAFIRLFQEYYTAKE